MDMSDDIEPNVLVTLRLKYIRNIYRQLIRRIRRLHFFLLGFIFTVTAVDDDDASTAAKHHLTILWSFEWRKQRSTQHLLFDSLCFNS